MDYYSQTPVPWHGVCVCVQGNGGCANLCVCLSERDGRKKEKRKSTKEDTHCTMKKTNHDGTQRLGSYQSMVLYMSLISLLCLN